jgi:peptidoglycan lytic transglycosylase
MYALTAAHRSLPFGTRVRVTSVETGRTVTVTITDRGPFAPDRVIDLSYAAATVLGLVGRGVGPVRLEIVPGE